MWFMNHVFNPIVRSILISPHFHWIASKHIVLIVFTGKKSQKHYTTPVEYLQEGQNLWIMVGSPEKKKWWKNLTESTLINLCLRGEWISGEAIAIRGDLDPNQVSEGLKLWIKKFPQIEKKVNSSEKISKTVLVKVLID